MAAHRRPSRSRKRRSRRPASTRARDLYATDATFRRAIDEWVENRRCDLRVVDYLLEQEPPMVLQAEAARWAATHPDRSMTNDRTGDGTCGPFPCRWEGVYYFVSNEGGYASYDDDSYCIPFEHFGRRVTHDTDKFPSAADALLWLLDNWVPA